MLLIKTTIAKTAASCYVVFLHHNVLIQKKTKLYQLIQPK